MTNYPVKSIDEVSDIESINMYNERLKAGYEAQSLIHAINVKGRDNARTPSQWDNTKNAGFTTGTPWLHVNPNYHQINVEAALKDPNSIFYTYQKLIKVRHDNPIVVDGNFELVKGTGDAVLAYYRILNKQKCLVVANLSSKNQPFSSEDQVIEQIITNYTPHDTLYDLTLQPYEAFAVKVK